MPLAHSPHVALASVYRRDTTASFAPETLGN